MKTALGFSYYNSEKEIPRALDPWVKHVDTIIAVDGRYKTPQTPEMRKKNQSKFSTDGSTILLKKYPNMVIAEYFGTQMEKRQKILDIAGEFNIDMLIVWDSDDIIHPEYQNWDLFNKQLDAIYNLWPEHQLLNMWAWIPDEKLWSKQHNEVPSNTWRKYTRIHRNPGEMRFTQNHFTWCKKDVTEDKVNKWKWKHMNDQPQPEHPLLLSPTITLEGIRITTDRLLRSPTELEFGNSWAFQNMHYESFQYELVPFLKHKGVKCIGMDLPMERYYFKPAGKYGDQEVGQIVLLNEDGTETLTHQEFRV